MFADFGGMEGGTMSFIDTFSREFIENVRKIHLSVKFYSVGEFSRNNKRGKPPLEWKCYNFRAQIKQRKGFPHGYYNKNWRNLE